MSEQEAVQFSSNAAVVYEQEIVPALFGQWPPQLADAAKIGTGDRVLDVGCGQGYSRARPRSVPARGGR